MEENQYFQLSWHGNVAVVVPSQSVETMSDPQIESAAELVLAPLRRRAPADVIIDLSEVSFFGTSFLSFLLRCHKIVRPQGSELVLAGCTDKVKELLHIMNFDTLWAIYDSRQEALEALR